MSEATIPVLNRFHVRALGLDITTSPRYAVPRLENSEGTCIACGREVGPLDAFVMCNCWSDEARDMKLAIVHVSCQEEMQREW